MQGYKIGNIDSVIVAQSPKLSAYIDSMRRNIAKACKTDINNISIKATTEGVSFTGEKLGVSAHCVCLLNKNNYFPIMVEKYVAIAYNISYLINGGDGMSNNKVVQ